MSRSPHRRALSSICHCHLLGLLHLLPLLRLFLLRLRGVRRLKGQRIGRPAGGRRHPLGRLRQHLPRDVAADFGDGSHAHWWRTCDARPPEQLFRDGVVLVGDAAHPFLPFTSQGANCALSDALRLGRALHTERTLHQALERYNAQTLREARQHYEVGRKLEDTFLSGQMTCLPCSR